MGLLGRKHSQVPIIPSRNHTGIASLPKEAPSAAPSTSMIAAKAATANMMKQQMSITTTSEPQTIPARPRRRMSTRVVLSQSQSPSQRSLSSRRQVQNPVYQRHQESSLENLSLQDNDYQHSLLSLQASSRAAQSAMLNSTEYLAPPPHHRVYASSASTSAVSSTHSLDSPSFHAKSAQVYSSDFFSHVNHSESCLSDSDIESLANDSASGTSKSGGARLLKNNSVVNIPSNISEYERLSMDHKLDEIPAIERKILRAVPSRKPPPGSPLFQSSADVSPVLEPPAHPTRRSNSPRRKPPPDVESTNDDFLMTVGELDEELPRYPLASDEEKKHHRHHVIRRGAKNILKKGLKSTTYTPSSFLAEPEGKKQVQLRTTMRKEKKKDVFNEDKPWKHHTDSETITENERKRYEGVWVTNKGLYMDLVDPEILNHDRKIPGELNTALKASMLASPTEILGPIESHLMVNCVVREIWKRSKLPYELLRQIWDLVDTRHDGTLDKTGFIVGMWLVDQCLYGRKLPKQVNDAVWNSVSRIGVNVVIKTKKK